MALTFLNSGMIELPATIENLSALDLKAFELQVDGLTANNISAITNVTISKILSDLTVAGSISSLNAISALGGNSDLWNSIYTFVQTSSSDWSSDLILPTLGHYLSTEVILLCSTNTDGIILSANNDLSDLFGNKTDLTNTITLVSLLQQTSSLWDNTYTTVNNVTSNYESVYSTVNILSTTWTGDAQAINSVTTTVNANSAKYESNYTTVNDLSNNWNNTYDAYNFERLVFFATTNTVNSLSSNWEKAYTSVFTDYATASAGFDLASSYVFASASNWNDSYTLLQNNSASYDQAATIALEVSGLQNKLQPTINNTIVNYPLTSVVTINSAVATDNNVKIYSNLTVFGSISALSAYAITDTIFLTSQATTVTALSVNGDITITSGKFLSANTELFDIFAIKTTDVNVLSGNWTNAYTTVNTSSANWNNTYTVFSDISGDLLGANTLIQTFSSDFTQVLPTVTNFLSTNKVQLSGVIIAPPGFENGSAIRVTQVGSGNLITLENQINDLTPTIINANGQIVTGHTATIATGSYFNAATTPKVSIFGQQTPDASLGLYAYGTGTNDAPSLIFSRTKSNLPDLFTGLTPDTVIGSITWTGDDGNSYIPGACLNAELDGGVTAGSVPMKIVFKTVAQGQTTQEERVRINSSGLVVVNAVSAQQINVNTTTVNSLTSNNFVLSGTSVPTLSTDPGFPGTIKWDMDYLYICVAADTWKRTALSAWNA